MSSKASKASHPSRSPARVGKENSVASKSTGKSPASSFILNKSGAECLASATPVKRVPLGNLSENTPSRLVSSDRKDPNSRGSIFSGAIRVPKREKHSSHSASTTPCQDHQTPTRKALAQSGSTPKKNGTQKSKCGYMQPTEAYRLSLSPAVHRSPSRIENSNDPTALKQQHARTPTRTPTRSLSHNNNSDNPAVQSKASSPPSSLAKSPEQVSAASPSSTRRTRVTSTATPPRSLPADTHRSPSFNQRTKNNYSSTPPAKPSSKPGKDVFSRLTANLPTRHTAPVVQSKDSSKNKKVPSSLSREKDNSKKKNEIRNSGRRQEQTRKSRLIGKSPNNVPRMRASRATENRPHSPKGKPLSDKGAIEDKENLNGKSLIRESSSSSIVSSFSTLPNCDVQISGVKNIAGDANKIREEKDIEYRVKSPFGNMNQQALPRSMSVTPIAMSDDIELDYNDTSDLTMTTLGSLPSVMPLLASDSCISLSATNGPRTKQDEESKAEFRAKMVDKKARASSTGSELFLEDAEDLSEIYEQGAALSRASSPRCLSISACWTQTTQTSAVTRAPSSSPFSLADASLDSSAFSSLRNWTSKRACSPTKSLKMKSLRDNALATSALSGGCDISIAATVLSRMSTPAPDETVSSELDRGMIREDLPLSAALEGCPREEIRLLGSPRQLDCMDQSLSTIQTENTVYSLGTMHTLNLSLSTAAAPTEPTAASRSCGQRGSRPARTAATKDRVESSELECSATSSALNKAFLEVDVEGATSINGDDNDHLFDSEQDVSGDRRWDERDGALRESFDRGSALPTPILSSHSTDAFHIDISSPPPVPPANSLEFKSTDIDGNPEWNDLDTSIESTSPAEDAGNCELKDRDIEPLAKILIATDSI